MPDSRPEGERLFPSGPGCTFLVPPPTAAGVGGLPRAGGDAAAGVTEASLQHPILNVLDGESMSADDAAWASIADAAEAALTLPGLSPACALELERAWAACRRAAGLHDQRPRSDSLTA